MAKYPHKSSSREKTVYSGIQLRAQSVMVGPSQQGEPEAAAHVHLSTVRKQNSRCFLGLSLLSVLYTGEGHWLRD